MAVADMDVHAGDGIADLDVHVGSSLNGHAKGAGGDTRRGQQHEGARSFKKGCSHSPCR